MHLYHSHRHYLLRSSPLPAAAAASGMTILCRMHLLQDHQHQVRQFALTIATATATAFATNGTNSCCPWPGVPKPPGSIRCGAAWLAQGWFMLLIMAANMIRDDDNDDSGSVYNVIDTAGYRCFGRCRGCKRNIHGSASW